MNKGDYIGRWIWKNKDEHGEVNGTEGGDVIQLWENERRYFLRDCDNKLIGVPRSIPSGKNKQEKQIHCLCIQTPGASLLCDRGQT